MTANDGSYALTGMGPGRYSLEFSRTGYFDQTVRDIAALGVDQYVQDVELYAKSIQGVVTDNATGDVLEDVTVTLTTNQGSVSMQTGPDGIYRFTEFGTGDYTLQFHRDDYYKEDTTTYTITVSGPGGTATASVTIAVSSQQPTVQISATPITILEGESFTLSWSAAHADTCTIEPDIGTVATSGSLSVYPIETTTYTITASDLNGNTATDSVSVTVNTSITLQITAPSDDAVIDRPNVMVQGTFSNSNGNETGITVNGVLALVYGNQFVANHVPLQDGDNTLTVTATDSDGDTRSTSIDVTAIVDTDYIRIMAFPESGVSPLETRLKIDGSFSITNSLVSYSGPGAVEFSEREIDGRLAGTTEPGLYYFTAEVEKDGVLYTDTVAILVMDQSQLDAQLQTVFACLKTALAAGDVETTASAFTARSRERYQEAFEELSGSLQQIAADMDDIEMIYVHDDVAKYRIRRPMEIDGEIVDITYYLYFRVDMDGLWRFEQF